MGRYYSGDIEGKFWFAVQPSSVPEQFGFREDINMVDYSIDRNVWEDEGEKEMMHLKRKLGKSLKVFTTFFEKNNGYNNEMLKTYFKEHNEEFVESKLRDFADYQFGLKVRNHFKDKEMDYCLISAEI